VPAYLSPTAPIAPDALLPSDPGQALRIAQELLDSPRMSNHSHGLWGYHGVTEGRRAVTIQSTGIGGPSAAAVLEELAELGVRRAIRVGACEALRPGLEPGATIVVETAIAADGTSAALGAEGRVRADRELTGELIRAAGPNAITGTVLGTDLLRGGDRPSTGAAAADLESAALLAQGARLGVAVASLLVVEGPRPREDGERGAEPVADDGVGPARIASAALLGHERSPGPGASTRP
jgi:uridine phosphorylase